MAPFSLTAMLLRLLLAACALSVAAAAAARTTGGCFALGELCARSFVPTPCCPGLACKGQSGYDVNARCAPQ